MSAVETMDAVFTGEDVVIVDAVRSGAGGQPTLDGYRLVFWVAGGICVAAAGVVWALIGDRPVTHRTGPVESLTRR